MRSRLRRPLITTDLAPHCYEAQTDLIQVSVTPMYLEEESCPEKSDYVWMYHIAIDNGRDESIKIVGTYWRLVDCYGQIEEVRGSNIGGEQPTIRPGDDYHYMNAVSLRSPSGMMSGTYHVKDKLGASYEIAIPTISLDNPSQSKTLH